MAELWTEAGDGWEVASPVGYEQEEELKELIELNPRLLPLSCSPHLTVLGREVYIGNCLIDVLAVESTGRPVVIEAKLASNYEARRRVVAQLLEYGAVLMGIDASELEDGPRLSSVADRGHDTIYQSVSGEPSSNAPDEDSFYSTMQAHLDRGDFRLVLVLDDAPLALLRIVHYLDKISADAVTIDLITVRMYDVDGARVVLTERVVPDPEELSISLAPTATGSSPVRSEGADVFRNSTADVTGDARTLFDRLITWAEDLSELPHVRLRSGEGMDSIMLYPQIASEDVGLVTIYNFRQRPSLDLHWSVIERFAPSLVDEIRGLAGAEDSLQRSYIHEPSSELLEALTAAYYEAEGSE